MNIQTLKAKDLRIGNYVVFNTNDKPLQITPAGLLEISQIEGKPNPYFYEPIKLTENWLLKFGFTNIDQTNIYVKSMHKIGVEKLKSLAVYIDENNYTVAIVDYYTGVEKSDLLHLDYEYVNQLQNLYYSLTGVELLVS